MDEQKDAGGESMGIGIGPVSDLPADRMQQLMRSVLPLSESVARTIVYGPKKTKKQIGTGTCFLVLQKDTRSFFMTCEHNLPVKKNGEKGYIRLSNGTVDYPFEEHYADATRDFAVISAKNIPQDLKPLEFSTEKILHDQGVTLLGYRAPKIRIKNKWVARAMVTVPSPIPGRICIAPYKKEEIKPPYVVVKYTCSATLGVSGSPLIRDGKVIGMHEATDESVRESITALSIREILAEWLEIGKDNEHTLEDLIKMLGAKITGEEGQEQQTMTDSWKCEFCHSSEISECAGPLLHYLKGEPVRDDQAWKSNVLHVHEKCIEWAPQAFFVGDIVKNLENELARASKIKCRVCGLKGAALGCLVRSCRQSFHLPCAHGIPGCRWDEGNFVMLCPSHSSKKLPCERLKPKRKAAQLKGSSSDTILGDLDSPFPVERNELWTASPFLTSEWMICGSALSDRDKEVLDQFQSQTGVTVTNSWSSNVTHVIANTDEKGSCCRTLKVLLAILAGKWVVNVNWLKTCLEAREPIPEEPFEISSDVHGSIDGPRTGRLRAMAKAPGLFSGLAFYFTGDVLPISMANLENLIATAGGSILDKAGLSSTSLILYNMEVPAGGDQDNIKEVLEKRRADAEELAATVGCRALAHTWVFDSIAFCKVKFP